MQFCNARIFTEAFQFAEGSFRVENGKFTKVLEQEAAPDAIDLHGATVIPGLIDIHNHGNSGADFSDGNFEGLTTMARYLPRSGITSFTPASMTLPYDVLARAFATARQLADAQPPGTARLMGIHMEGPFFSEAKKGAQNGDYLQLPDFEAFWQLHSGCGELVRIVDVAPELPGAAEFIRRASDVCTVSMAHTNAGYEDTVAGIAAGATHLTHLFNAMQPLHHRNPGPIAAAAEAPQVRAELICDGIHVHPSMIRLAFSLFGAERICLISDALSCCGMSDGTYMLGGQEVTVRGKLATLASGTLAGSATNLFDCMNQAISFGIPAEDAIRAATWNPACAIGAEQEIGSIANGKFADFIICGPDFQLQQVYLAGISV